MKGYAPNGHWKTTTFVAGLTSGGIIAPLVVDAPMNRAVCTQYGRQFLAPELGPSNIVVMDNLSSHKAIELEAPRDRAMLRFLPAYLNLRTAVRAERAREKVLI